MQRDPRLLVILAVPTIVIAGLFVSQYATVATGDEIHLEVVEPIDPRDVFRGQYATLQYSISTIDAETVPSGTAVTEGDTVYVTLEDNGIYWRAQAVSAGQPADADRCIKGTVTGRSGDTLQVRYGIEQFFASPERARQIEEERWRNDVTGIVSVDDACDAVLRGLIVGNETIRTGD